MIMPKSHLAGIILALALAGAAFTSDAPALKYPEAKQGDVVDDYHGTKVPDPYRWLEDPDSPETRAWVAAENEITMGYLAGLPGRDALKKRITELWNYPKTQIPAREAGRLFYRKNSGLQQQGVRLD